MAATGVVTTQGDKQFLGLYKEMWTISSTRDWSSIAAAAEVLDTITIPGLALGDQVICWGAGIDANADLMWDVWVSATDTLSVTATNTDTSAVDLADTTWKFIVGRPTF
jgi:hypothetical protein